MINHFPYVSRNGVKIGEAFKKYIDFLKAFPDSSLALSSSRQLSTKATDIMRVRRSSDNAESDFSAQEVANGTLLDYVVPTDVQALYGERMYFDGVDDGVDVGKPSNTVGVSYLDIESKYVTNASGSFEPVASRYGGATDIGWVIGKDNSNRAYGQLSNDGTTTGRITLTGTTNIDDGEEHTIRMLLDSGTAYLYVDGVEEDSLAFTGNIFTTTDNMRIGASGISFAVGSIYDVKLTNSSGVIVNQWQGYGNTNADWEDQVGSNDGTVSGSPALFTGQGFNAFVPIWYDQRVPTSTQKMYFDGVDDYVSDDLGTFYADNNKITLEIDINDVDYSGTNYIASLGSDNSNGFRVISFSTATSLRVELEKAGSVVASNIGNQMGSYTFVFDITNHSISITKPDGTTGSDNLTLSAIALRADGGLHIGKRPSFNDRFSKGSFSNVKLKDQNDADFLEWTGDGNQDEHWTDQVGSNDGTVNGSPARYNPDTGAISNDPTQTTAGSQPAIVKDGAVVLENGKPALMFNGVDDRLQTQAFALSQPTHHFIVTTSDVNDSNPHAIVSGLTSANRNQSYLSSLNSKWNIFSGSVISGGTSDTNQHLWSSLFNGATSVLHIDGTSTASGNAGTDTLDGVTIGDDGLGAYWEGTCQEIIIFEGNKSSDREKIEGNINRHYKIY